MRQCTALSATKICAISSSIFWVNGALIDTSTVVTSMRGHGARSTMCAASGSNQKLNSWRGLVANSGSSVCGLRLPPITTMPCVSEANSGSITTASAMFVSGPAA